MFLPMKKCLLGKSGVWKLEGTLEAGRFHWFFFKIFLKCGSF